MLLPERSSHVLFAIMSLMLGTDSFHWTDSVHDETEKYLCSGDDLDIPWNFAKGPGEDISQVQWFFRGLSEELVAILVNGQFIVMASFSGRVRFTPEAGIQLLQVVPTDAGNYSVQVSSHVGSGLYFSDTRSVVLKVEVPPSIDAGTVRVLQNDVAVTDSAGQAHVQLTCGHFTSLGEPPVMVVWRTPWGTMEPSTSYENGNFHYLLPNPFHAGQYTCSVYTEAAAPVCLSESFRLQLTHALELDVDRARQTLHNTGITSGPTTTTTTSPPPTTLPHAATIATADDPCISHTELDEVNRLNQNQSGGMCDATLREGWYRFRPSGNDDGYIPSTCVQSPSCSTAIPVWMDLGGQSMPQRNQEITVRVYGSTEQGGCHDRTQMPQIKVRRCDQYFVYYLYPTSCTFGKSAYCVTTTAP